MSTPTPARNMVDCPERFSFDGIDALAPAAELFEELGLDNEARKQNMLCMMRDFSKRFSFNGVSGGDLCNWNGDRDGLAIMALEFMKEFCHHRLPYDTELRSGTTYQRSHHAHPAKK